jgi:hypothetical protein
LPRFVDPSVTGVFMAEPVSNVVGGLASFITMYFTVYRRLDKPSYRHYGTHRPSGSDNTHA